MDDPEEFQNKPLSALARLRAGLPPGPAGSARDADTDAAADSEARGAAGLGEPVVRRERKQRRGKTVTRVARLNSNAKDLASLARELAKALGCGAKVEGEDIVLQGDQVERAATWLERRGARRVVRGN